jgi:SAM-dependent methyltransferase
LTMPPLVRVPCPLCGGGHAKHERVVGGFALERCRECGFVFTNPRYPADGVLGQYRTSDDDEADKLELWARITTPSVLAEHERILDELEAASPSRMRLLDFGCGPCYFLERAARRGWDAHGVEVAPWAREAARLRGLPNVHIGLLAERAFADGYFDVIHSSQVLEHLDDPRSELEELFRVLRPGGLLYVNVPNYHRIPVMLDLDDFATDTPMGHLNYFTPRTLSRLLGAGGFEVLRTSTRGGLKLENLLGRPTRSDILDALRSPPGAGASSRDDGGRPSAVGRLAKGLLHPLVRTLAYRMAQLGMTLEAFARKPERAPRRPSGPTAPAG